ncbi:MAG: hypothetical protein P4L55_15230 [Syntrophobacteraceae bacterium]|nr:hypothetical protein [Syntrophobacteraceae bacterium]
MNHTLRSKTKTQEFTIDLFRTEDAPGIARLFRETYGEGYPIKTYYLPDRLIEENGAGRIISWVARVHSGEVIAHDALVLLDPDSHLYENAAGAVLPAFRGRGIFPPLFKDCVFKSSERCRVDGVVGEPVCNHTHLQKMCRELGFRESGLEIDLMPEAAYVSQPEGSNRVSVLMGFFMLKSGSLAVNIPVTYRDELEYIYLGLGLERTFELSREGLPSEGTTLGTMETFEFAQVARIRIDRIGADFEAFVARLERGARENSAGIFQVWLPLASSFISAATDALRANGYFLGGILPGLRNGDCLLMQKATLEPDWERILLYSERALKIGEMIRRDWQHVRQEP